jgi:hypothetical protein
LKSLPTRQALDPLHEVLPRVENHLVGAGLAGELGFLLGGDGPDDARAAHLGDLAEEQAHAPAAAWTRQASPGRSGHVLQAR